MERYCGLLGVRLPSPTRQPKLHRACDLLVSRLGFGSQPADYIYELARENDVSARTLKSAKKHLRVVTVRRGWGRGSRIWWRLALPIGGNTRLVGIPLGPHGSFVWVKPVAAKAYTARVRREAKARGESVPPELTRRQVEGDYPPWWEAERHGPENDLERAEWRRKRRT